MFTFRKRIFKDDELADIQTDWNKMVPSRVMAKKYGLRHSAVVNILIHIMRKKGFDVKYRGNKRIEDGLK